MTSARRRTPASRTPMSTIRTLVLCAPFLAALVWPGALLAMLVVWLVRGRPLYESMSESQDWVFISDIGATDLKPLFVVACCVTGVALVVVLAFLVIVRRRTIYFTTSPSNTLPTTTITSNTALGMTSTRRPRIYALISLAFGAIGSLCVILLSGFDTMMFESPHRAFLFAFLVCYLASAIFTVLELKHLRRLTTTSARTTQLLRRSYTFKLSLLAFLGVCVVAFVVCLGLAINAAMVLEWAVAFLFTGYVASFVDDVRTVEVAHEDAEKAGRVEVVSSEGQQHAPELTERVGRGEETV